MVRIICAVPLALLALAFLGTFVADIAYILRVQNGKASIASMPKLPSLDAYNCAVKAKKLNQDGLKLYFGCGESSKNMMMGMLYAGLLYWALTTPDLA